MIQNIRSLKVDQVRSANLLKSEFKGGKNGEICKPPFLKEGDLEKRKV